jgi:putative transposase
VLEQVGCRYRFVVVGYVVMPEHVHLLLGESKRGNPSVVMRALADSRQETVWDAPLEFGHIWQRRFYDFVVFSEKKRVEKLRYMHPNPVVRGLVLEAEHWAWSSFRHYAYQERGTVMVNEMERSELRVRKIS